MASSSSSSPFAPTISSWLSKPHVFISYRGEDTRKNLVGHLRSGLEQEGIFAFKDDGLPQGELICPSLMKAIEESYISVIVFSKNYANSSWCLDELDHIMKCRDIRGKIVIPIFHQVDPSTVRKQKWRYGLALLIHKVMFRKNIESWRNSLVYASNHTGWETKHIANGDESQCIKIIVDAISMRLRLLLHTEREKDDLVGIEARMQDFKPALQIGSGGVSMVAIYGFGGSGKTTLASSIYDEISSTFDGCCFIRNVRKESIANGLEKVQEKMLSRLLKHEQVHVTGVEEGRGMIANRLRHRKVLIVLDDVDRLDQLEALAGSINWFGEGSRIIITTRDQHLLIAHRVNVIHNVSLLSDDEAMQLFCNHAFRHGRPIEDYDQLSIQVVCYSDGRPLAVKLLGSFLSDKEVNVWRSVVDRLQEFPHYNILETLKICYDGLEPMEKRLFLDIARFFRGDHTHEGVMTMLDDWGSHHVRGTKLLIRMGLISISDGEFFMDNLVQEMAHYINREEQVWKNEDHVNMDATTVGANIKKPWWNRLKIKDIVGATRGVREKFQAREHSRLTLSDLVQKQLWDAYRADNPYMLPPQTSEMNYHNSLTPGDRGISHGYDPTAKSYDENGDTRLNLKRKIHTVCNATEKEILRRFRKGKNKVEMEDLDMPGTLEDRIVNRMEGFFEERMNKLENRMVEMERMVVKGMKMLTNKTVEIQGGVVQRMESLTDRMAELEEGVVERFKNEMVERMTINQKMLEIE